MDLFHSLGDRRGYSQGNDNTVFGIRDVKFHKGRVKVHFDHCSTSITKNSAKQTRDGQRMHQKNTGSR